ncbi:Ankyrin repeat protein 1 [Giardia muris]|uniref:Ankyrin repeat protein 1 n=1 Tax=Giardia muris TaxID=5742 RepID=A0A4Z1SMU6_GIAMU|nr:Ankyrin repeat protein 1 [Giardia muris]|eukprot:TNJ27016.1 Ankyrin repeat protein 1 [Giardia muris]
MSVADWFAAVEAGDLGFITQNLDRYKLSTNAQGETALIVAARLNKISLVRTLAPHEHGHYNREQKTALMISASRDYPDICEILAPYEAHLYGERRRDSLMIAAKSVSVESLSVLLKYIKCRRDDQDLSVLDYAVLAESLVCVRLLLQNLRFEESDLETALSLARAKDLGSIETALREQIDHIRSLESTQIDVQSHSLREGFKLAASASNVIDADRDSFSVSCLHGSCGLPSQRTSLGSKFPRTESEDHTPMRQTYQFANSRRDSTPTFAATTPLTGVQTAYTDTTITQIDLSVPSATLGNSYATTANKVVTPRTDDEILDIAATIADTTKSAILGALSGLYVKSPVLSQPSAGPPAGTQLDRLTERITEQLAERLTGHAADRLAASMGVPDGPEAISEIAKSINLAVSQLTTTVSTPLRRERPQPSMYQPSSLQTYHTQLPTHLLSVSPSFSIPREPMDPDPEYFLARLREAQEMRSTTTGSSDTASDTRSTINPSPLDAIESWKDVQRYITALESHGYVKLQLAAASLTQSQTGLNSSVTAQPPTISAPHTPTRPAVTMPVPSVRLTDSKTMTALDMIASLHMSPAVNYVSSRLATPLKSTHLPDVELDSSLQGILQDLPKKTQERVTDFIANLYRNMNVLESSIRLNAAQGTSRQELEELREENTLQRFEINTQTGIIEMLTLEVENLRAQGGSEYPERVDADVQTSTTEAWFAAVRNRDLPAITRQISQYMGTRDESGMTALMIACGPNGSLDAATSLLGEAGAQQQDGFTALMHAALANNFLAVKLLLDREAYAVTSCRSLWTPGCNALMMAARCGHTHVIEVLTERLGGEKDAMGYTALHYAVLGGHLGALHSLLQKSICFTAKDVEDCIDLASVQGYSEMTQVLEAVRQNKDLTVQRYIKECYDLRARVQDLEYQLQVRQASESSRESRPGTAVTTPPLFAQPRRSAGMRPGSAKVSESEIISAIQYVIEARRGSNAEAGVSEVPKEQGVPATKVAISPMALSDIPSPQFKSLGAQHSLGSMLNTQTPQARSTDLFQAILSRNLTDVQALAPTLARRLNGEGQSALMVAISIGFTDAALVLVSHEAGLTDPVGRTALMYCVQYDNIRVAKELVKKEAGARTTRDHTRGCCTALMLSGIEDRIELVRLLIETEERGAQNEQGETALMLAVQEGSTACIRTLLEGEARLQNEKGCTALMLAAERRGTPAVTIQELADREAGMTNKAGETALMIAAQQNFTECVRILQRVESGYQNRRGRTALELALEAGAMDAARMLLTTEAPYPDSVMSFSTSDDLTELMQAAEINDIALVYVRMREQAGGRDSNGRTALMIAAERGYTGIVRLLAEQEARMQMHGKDWKNGATALMLAAGRGHTNAVACLAEREIGMTNKEGRTALMFAAWNGHADCVRILRDSEQGKVTSPEYELGEGFTALMAAATNGHRDCIKLLTGEAHLVQPTGRDVLYWAKDEQVRLFIQDCLGPV